MPPNLNDLSYPKTLEESAYKSISVLFPVVLVGGIPPQVITITDSGLQLVDFKQEESAQALLRSHLEKSRELPMRSIFILNQFAAPRKEKLGFELTERAATLRIAISILTGKACFKHADFQYDDSADPPVYHRPFVFHDDLGRDSRYYRKPAAISVSDDFEILQTIYNNLTRLEIWMNDDRFSKLFNAIRFHTYFTDHEWVLQKIVFAFVVLESIFSDTSRTEITEKVAIRAAYFLDPDDVAKRHDLYDVLKIAYRCRSNFVHGSDVKTNKLEKELQALKQNGKYSLFFDLPDELRDITSRVLRRILTDEPLFAFFSSRQTEKAEADFYNQLVLGRKSM